MAEIIEITPPTQEDILSPIPPVPTQEGEIISQRVDGIAQTEPEGEVIELTPPDRSFLEAIGEETLGGLEFGTSLLTGAGSAVTSGLGGLAQLRGPTSTAEGAEDTIRKIQEGLTFVPRTGAGKRNVEKVGGFFADAAQFAKENNIPILTPLVQVFSQEDNPIGNFAADVARETGSPTLEAFAGAFGATLPTAFLEILGFKGVGRLSKKIGDKQGRKFEKDLKEATAEAALPAEKLKDVSRGVYKEIDDLGATVKPEQYNRLVDDIQKELKEGGFRERIDDKVAALLDEFEANRGSEMSVSDVDDLRTVAQGFAKSQDPKTKALGLRMMDSVDNFLDSEGVLNIPSGAKGNVGQRYRQARKFWGQARRSEKIQQLRELAEDNRASFLQGVQTEFKQLIRQGIKGKGDGKYFSKEDRRIMQEVVKADKTTNIAKNLAKLQITRAGGGSLIPLMGPSGSLIAGLATGDVLTAGSSALFPLLGEVANSLAVKLTKKNLKMADGLIRAGADGRRIARVYFEQVPKGERSVGELALLISDPSIDISKLPKTKFTKEAIEQANKLRQQKIFLGGQGVVAQGATAPEEEDPVSSTSPFSGLAEGIKDFLQ